uniref:PA domain-containing protein n=1 Tax=Globodera pallida TaxID=36090 RepID=A0A183CCB0_GLOPA
MKNAMVSWDFKVSHNAFCLLLFFFVLLTSTTNAQYLVEILERAQLGGHRPVVRCDATGANFGQDIVEFSFEMSSIGCALPTEPFDACGNVTKPELNTTAHCLFEFAVVPRGNCTFSEKAFFAQTAEPNGYSAIIVFSAKGQNPIPMSGSKYADKVKIPVVMVNYACMQSLLYGQYTARHAEELHLQLRVAAAVLLQMRDKTPHHWTLINRTKMLNASQMSSALEDLTNVGVHAATSSTNAASPFQLVRSSLAGMRDKLTNLIRHQKSDGSNPHTLLENEDDASTLAREEAADTLSRQTCETLDDTNGGSSNDGHSMTTMHSNRQLNAVAVDLSCAVALSPPPSDGVNEFQSMPDATADEQQQQQQQQQQGR